jgi:hypothetical protein
MPSPLPERPALVVVPEWVALVDMVSPFLQ